jgi:hypothetical protein
LNGATIDLTVYDPVRLCQSARDCWTAAVELGTGDTRALGCALCGKPQAAMTVAASHARHPAMATRPPSGPFVPPLNTYGEHFATR